MCVCSCFKAGLVKMEGPARAIERGVLQNLSVKVNTYKYEMKPTAKREQLQGERFCTLACDALIYTHTRSDGMFAMAIRVLNLWCPKRHRPGIIG